MKILSSQLCCLGGLFDYDNAIIRYEELQSLTSDASLWDDAEKAQKLLSEKNQLEAEIAKIDEFEKNRNELVELCELAEAENNQEMIVEIVEQLKDLKVACRRGELEALLNGEADGANAFLEVHSGSGGTEAQDWAEMLLRMYSRWADAHSYKVEYIEESEGDVAGLKSATIKICGHNAYGWLKSENGVHRLVRISPFDSNARRHTSFASIIVYPEVDDKINIVINEADCRVDTYRASGAGGQHINKTDSAVRITHIPTGIVVQSQNQRSQFQNRDTAWKMLKARLYEMEMQKKEAAEKGAWSEQGDNGWGYQIRSYVLQPYKMVKDLRTEVETSDTKAVLDGDIDLFLEAALADKVVK